MNVLLLSRNKIDLRDQQFRRNCLIKINRSTLQVQFIGIVENTVQSRTHLLCQCAELGGPVGDSGPVFFERTSGDNTPFINKLAFPSQQ
jgi:hypothetical protein